MLDWLKRVITSPASRIIDLAGQVYNAVRGLWHRLADLADGLRRGWDRLLPAISVFGGWLGEAFEFLRVPIIWIIDLFVPGFVRAAISLYDRVIRPVIGRAAELLRGLISNLSSWARTAINTLTSWARDAVNWLTGRLNTALNWITKAGKWLWDTVSHADRLAAWVAPHLMRPVTQFIIGQATAIGRWVLGRAVGAALASARIVESVIVRLL